MSTRTTRFLCLLLFGACIAAVALGGVSCGNRRDKLASVVGTDPVTSSTAVPLAQTPIITQSPSERGHSRFLAAINAVNNRKFKLYWLGREFTDGVLMYYGPSFAGTADNDADVLELGYTSRLPTGGGSGFSFTLYSRDGWENSRKNQLKPEPGIVTTDIEVDGHPAQLIKIPAFDAPINVLILVIDLGDTVVMADTAAANPAPPGGPNPNPLIADPNRFIEVMSHLRPYPD